MHEPDLRRLNALTAAIGNPTVVHAAIGDDAAAGADAQRMTTPQVDALLRRVTAVTALLGNRGAEWDEIDQLAAQLLMSDLAAIASLTRALNRLSASRLTDALADLIAAGQDAERVLTRDN